MDVYGKLRRSEYFRKILRRRFRQKQKTLATDDLDDSMAAVVFGNVVELSVFRHDADIVCDDARSLALVASYDLIDAAAQGDFLLEMERTAFWLTGDETMMDTANVSFG